jgi:hypothetical protein
VVPGSIACTETPGSAAPAQASAAAASSLAEAPASHLRIDGREFRTSTGAIWPWRGITAFRLLEQLAAGREQEVERYLAWAAGEKLSVVRVLAMARHLFELPPALGRAHLDDLLVRAARHGLYVEVVALADTAAVDVPVEEQVRAIATIAARHPNAILELANEPNHHTQRPQVGKARRLGELLALVPGPVPVAMGALEHIDELDPIGPSIEGDYVTFHFPRSSGQQGWGHVLRLAEGHEAEQQLGKPVINDEPIGAGATFQPGRRDDNPDRMRAAALLTRMTGMGGTFHYEGGLHARIPEGPELAAFNAWQEAWSHLPADVESAWTFRKAGAPEAATLEVTGAAGAWEVQRGDDAWLLIAAADPEPQVAWARGWREAKTITWTGSQLRRAVRTKP